VGVESGKGVREEKKEGGCLDALIRSKKGCDPGEKGLRRICAVGTGGKVRKVWGGVNHGSKDSGMGGLGEGTLKVEVWW